jgi:hypothetical protein
VSFGADVRGFAQRTGIKFDLILRKVVIDMTSEIVKMTPVHTGHARSNYFWGNSRVSDIDPTMSQNGSPSLARSLTFSGAVKAGGTCYITNNLPYIMRLEYGWSKQAAAGMARVTVARWQNIVNAAVRSL